MSVLRQKKDGCSYHAHEEVRGEGGRVREEERERLRELEREREREGGMEEGRCKQH